jgi:hypothetical protein
MPRTIPHRLDIARRRSLALALLATASLALPARAADTIGTAIQVSRQAMAQAPGATRELSLGAPVAARDTIVTNAAGQASLRFVDNTQVQIGPGSSVKLDSFVFNTSSTASSVVVRASRGLFRFITGNSSHDTYRIITPTATIAVRGTAFDVIMGGRTDRISVIDGRIIVCPNRGRANSLDCVEAGAGESVVATSTRATVAPLGQVPQRRGDGIPPNLPPNLPADNFGGGIGGFGAPAFGGAPVGGGSRGR